MAVLDVRGLGVAFDNGSGDTRVVEDVSFTVQPGLTHALVGESGSGKSVSASSIMRLLPRPWGKIVSGSIRLEDLDILSIPEDRLPSLRGGRVAMIFQEPMTALNPVKRAGAQITEALLLHRPELDRRGRQQAMLDLLREVELPNPETNARAFPFQLSGGMRQRVMIAMALAGRPEFLIADEPTTALDVTVQAQILRLLERLQVQHGMGMLYITHDLGVVAHISHHISIMYAGQIVESGPAREVLRNPLHPYARALRDSSPRMDSKPKSRLAAIEGTVPVPKDYPSAACRFAPRCPLAGPECQAAMPRLEAHEGSSRRQVRCFKAGQA